MNKLKAYKFRLYPNATQEVSLNKTFGCVRYAWNQNVANFLTYDKDDNPKPIFKTSTELRNEIEWMKEVSASAIQQKEMDFKEFKTQLFNAKRKSKIGFPKFKKKSNRQSYRLPNQKFKIVNGKLQLEKIGKIKFIQDREFPEFFKFMNVTISKNPSGEYYASSKTCGCGVKNDSLKLSDRVWTCGSCGTKNNRDELASLNILKEGRRSLGDLG